jgi:hypothetical protein
MLEDQQMRVDQQMLGDQQMRVDQQMLAEECWQIKKQNSVTTLNLNVLETTLR